MNFLKKNGEITPRTKKLFLKKEKYESDFFSGNIPETSLSINKQTLLEKRIENESKFHHFDHSID